MPSPTVASLGEIGLIERLKPYCAVGALGDDAALMKLGPGRSLVVTTDVLVEDVHFSDRTTPPRSVGWRSAAANLSDLAAMGAAPLGITVGLALPPETPWDWVADLYQGMQDCLEQYGGAIYGGDVCRADQKTVSITALGQVDPQRVIYRHVAQPGQAIVVTGWHGAARAGLALLLEEIAADGVSDPVRQAWIATHQRPRPRFDAVDLLQQMDLTWPIAGMDSSDGLANAVMQICRRSGVGAQIMRSRLPIPPHLSDCVGPELALDWTLQGGEDFELVLCLPPEAAQSFVQRLGGEAAIVGSVTSVTDILLVETEADSHGQPLDSKGFQHF